MNTLSTDGFIAERQRNGDVWITAKSRKWTHGHGKLAPKESDPVIIPCDKCQELAELLLGVVISNTEKPDIESFARTKRL